MIHGRPFCHGPDYAHCYCYRLWDELCSLSTATRSFADFCQLPRQNGQWCSKQMFIVQRKQGSGRLSISWRCTSCNCRTERSVRSTCKFLTYERSDGRGCSKLSLCQILHLLYLWLHTTSTLRQLHVVTGHSLQTLTDWSNLFREVCSISLRSLPKLIGSHEVPVQIDESYFRGRRKYNRERFLFSNLENNGNSSDEEGVADASQIPGPWVLGICTAKSDVRFLIVPDRSANTLLYIIEENAALHSVIWSDKWISYNGLTALGYIHNTVNHSEHFIDTITGANTKRMERLWKEGKLWLKRVRRPTTLRQSHLDELRWRHNNADHPNLFPGAFLEAVKDHYTCPVV